MTDIAVFLLSIAVGVVVYLAGLALIWAVVIAVIFCVALLWGHRRYP